MSDSIHICAWITSMCVSVNLNYLLKDPISKYSHTGEEGFHMSWGRGRIYYSVHNRDNFGIPGGISSKYTQGLRQRMISIYVLPIYIPNTELCPFTNWGERHWLKYFILHFSIGSSFLSFIWRIVLEVRISVASVKKCGCSQWCPN